MSEGGVQNQMKNWNSNVPAPITDALLDDEKVYDEGNPLTNK